MIKHSLLLRVITIAIIHSFLLCGISFAIIYVTNDYTLAPPSVVDSDSRARAASFDDRWAFEYVSNRIANMLVQTQESAIQMPGSLLTSLIEADVSKMSDATRSAFQRFDIHGIEEVHNAAGGIAGFAMRVASNGSPDYRFVYNLDSGDRVIQLEDGSKVYVRIEVLKSHEVKAQTPAEFVMRHVSMLMEKMASELSNVEHELSELEHNSRLTIDDRNSRLGNIASAAEGLVATFKLYDNDLLDEITLETDRSGKGSIKVILLKGIQNSLSDILRNDLSMVGSIVKRITKHPEMGSGLLPNIRPKLARIIMALHLSVECPEVRLWVHDNSGVIELYVPGVYDEAKQFYKTIVTSFDTGGLSPHGMSEEILLRWQETLQGIRVRGLSIIADDERQFLSMIAGRFDFDSDYLAQVLRDKKEAILVNKIGLSRIYENELYAYISALSIVVSAELESLKLVSPPNESGEYIDIITSRFIAHELGYLYSDMLLLGGLFPETKARGSELEDAQGKRSSAEKDMYDILDRYRSGGERRDEIEGWRFLLTGKAVDVLKRMPRKTVLVLMDKLMKDIEEIIAERTDLLSDTDSIGSQMSEDELKKYKGIAAACNAKCMITLSLIEIIKQTFLRKTMSDIIYLNDSIEKAMIAYRPYQDYRGINLKFNRGDNLPPVIGDNVKISYVWLNLFENSIRAIIDSMENGRGPEKGEISVATEIEKGHIKVTVRDNGGGIPDNVLLKLKALYQNGGAEEEDITTKGDGHGKASRLIAETVKAMGGTIDVESTLGEGTTFIIRLPVVISPVVPAAFVIKQTEALRLALNESLNDSQRALDDLRGMAGRDDVKAEERESSLKELNNAARRMERVCENMLSRESRKWQEGTPEHRILAAIKNRFNDIVHIDIRGIGSAVRYLKSGKQANPAAMSLRRESIGQYLADIRSISDFLGSCTDEEVRIGTYHDGMERLLIPGIIDSRETVKESVIKSLSAAGIASRPATSKPPRKPRAGRPLPSEAEVDKLIGALREAEGDKVETARILGIHRSVIYRNMGRYQDAAEDIGPEKFRELSEALEFSPNEHEREKTIETFIAADGNYSEAARRLNKDVSSVWKMMERIIKEIESQERLVGEDFKDIIQVLARLHIASQPVSSDRPVLIVALGTSWINGHAEDGSQYEALSPLVSYMKNYCVENGLLFIDDNDDNLIGRVNEARAKDGYGKIKVVILAGRKTVEGNVFAEFCEENKDTVVAGVDDENLTGLSGGTGGYVRIMEMLTIALKLSTYTADDAAKKIGRISKHIDIEAKQLNAEGRARLIYILTPRADRIKYIIDPKKLYEIQQFA